MRKCWLLRFIEEQARYEALSQDAASSDTVDRARGDLGVVLYRPDGAGRTCGLSQFGRQKQFSANAVFAERNELIASRLSGNGQLNPHPDIQFPLHVAASSSSLSVSIICTRWVIGGVRANSFFDGYRTP